MRRIPGGLVAVLFLVGLAQAQESAASLSPSTKVATHFLPPPHASVTTTVVSISEQLDGPHWWNDHAMYHHMYSHGEVPNVAMLNRDGTIAFKTTLTEANLDRIRVTDAAATVDGGAVATATVVDKAGRPTSFVAQLDNSGKVIWQITTFPFMSEMTCPAEDGTVWVFGWDFMSDNRGLGFPYAILRHYSFTQGLLKVAPDWKAIGDRVLFGHGVAGGTAVACSAHNAWIYYGAGCQFISYDEEANSFRVYRVQLPNGSPSDVGVSGFARTTSGDFYASLNDGSEAWLGLYWLNVHDEVARWEAVDTPGNFTNGIRVFGSSGEDLVYARVAWQWPDKLEFSTMPPNMRSELLSHATRGQEVNDAPPSAKGETVKIVIQGADLVTPIQITDRKVLANIQVLSGKGTYSNEPRLEEPSFIIDWSQGVTAEPPKALPRYEISFYANLPNKRLAYVVSYAFDPVTSQGYVYLPGRNDKNYRLNVHTIIRRVEGKWFHSWTKWDAVAEQLIESHRQSQSLTSASRANPLENRPQ